MEWFKLPKQQFFSVRKDDHLIFTVWVCVVFTYCLCLLTDDNLLKPFVSPVMLAVFWLEPMNGPNELLIFCGCWCTLGLRACCFARTAQTQGLSTGTCWMAFRPVDGNRKPSVLVVPGVRWSRLRVPTTPPTRLSALFYCHLSFITLCYMSDSQMYCMLNLYILSWN